MIVREIMVDAVQTAAPDQTLREALDLMRSKHIRQLPVVEDGKLVGILTDRDVKRASPSILSHIDQEEYDRVLDETKIRQLMTKEPLTVTPTMSLKAALKIFISKKVGALPVVSDGRLVGIVTQTDALRVLDNMLKE
jgi:acetoin utilization protein AcuB